MSKWIGLESEWYWSLVDVQRELEQVMKEVTCIPTRQHVVLDLMSRQVAFHRLNPTLCRFSFLRVALPSVASFFCVSLSRIVCPAAILFQQIHTTFQLQ